MNRGGRKTHASSVKQRLIQKESNKHDYKLKKINTFNVNIMSGQHGGIITNFNVNIMMHDAMLCIE